MIDTRLMDLSGTRAGEIVLFARVSQVMASPDGVHDLQAAFMRGRQRRAVRLHSSEPLRVQVHNGDSILVRGVVDASSTGGLRLVFDPSALRVEHTHANRSTRAPSSTRCVAGRTDIRLVVRRTTGRCT